MTPTQTGDKPMVTLLPCPFCGGDAKLTEHEDCDVGGRWVVCTPCGAARWGDEPDEAITAWNMRHREQETREQPLDTIQRLGQEFDGPEASPSLGMGEALRAVLEEGLDQLLWINAQAENAMALCDNLMATDSEALAVSRMMLDSTASDIGVNAMMLHDKLSAALSPSPSDVGGER